MSRLQIAIEQIVFARNYSIGLLDQTSLLHFCSWWVRIATVAAAGFSGSQRFWGQWEGLAVGFYALVAMYSSNQAKFSSYSVANSLLPNHSFHNCSRHDDSMSANVGVARFLYHGR